MFKKIIPFNATVLRYYLFTFFIDLRFFSAILVPFFTQGAHLSLFKVQVLQSWYMISTFVFELPTGIIADHIGRKYSLASGALVLAFAVMIFGFSPSFQWFFVAEFFYGLGISFISGADKAFIYDALKEQRQENQSKKIFGLNYSIGLIAFFMSGSLSGYIASKFNLATPMFLSIIPFLFAGVIIFTADEPFTHGKHVKRESYIGIVKNGFKYLFHHTVLKLMAIDAIIVASTAYFVTWLYPSLLQKSHTPILYYGFFYLVLIGSEVLISSQFDTWEKWFGSPLKFLQFSAFITAISFIAVGIFPNILVTIIFIILAGGFGLTRFELINAYMNKYISSRERATTLAFINMVRRFVLVVFNPLVGFLATKSLAATLIFLGALTFTALLLPTQKSLK